MYDDVNVAQVEAAQVEPDPVNPSCGTPTLVLTGNCATLCDVHVLQQNTCTQTFPVCCVTGVPIRTTTTTDVCRVTIVDQCCEICEDCNGLMHANVHVTARVDIPFVAADGTKEFCTTFKTFTFNNVFESCFIKNCKVISAKGTCLTVAIGPGCQGELLQANVQFTIIAQACVLVRELQVRVDGCTQPCFPAPSVECPRT
jgi:hypothetical protein